MRREKKKEPKVYTRKSRYNLSITYEQYLFLLDHRQKARENHERVKYKQLAASWNMPTQYLAKAVNRGIMQYDERIKAEGRDRNSRQPIPARRVERRNESCPLGLWSKSAEARRAILREYTESGTVRRGYSPLIRVEYFED
jgi:hypothetical protein